jgi:sugar O-acyltransferase (sialic acid O-acetyltransferase NeuD family)
MKKYFVEKYNASDDSFQVTETFIKSGDFAEIGKIIISIESSKTTIDIEAQESGYVYFNFSEGMSINVGDLFFIISNILIDDTTNLFESQFHKPIEGYSISKKASVLMAQHNFVPSDFQKSIIKERDVLDLIQKETSKPNFELILKNLEEKTPIIIIGAGGGAKMCIDSLADSIDYQVVALIDDNKQIGTFVLGVPVVGKLTCIEELLAKNYEHFVIAFGVLDKRKIRYELYTNLKKSGCKFPNIIHPKAILEKSVVLGDGNVVLAGANIGSCVNLGNLNYLNNNSLVSHDCILEDNIHVAPGSVLASSIKVESHVLIGMNTTIYYGLTIGESSTILNGLTINNNIGKNIIQKTNN